MNRLNETFLRWRDSGDAAALAEVFDQAAPELLAVVRHLTPDEAEAEDVVQDTFLKALERARAFRGDGPLMGWLSRIAINEARQRRRRERTRRAAPASPTVDSRDPARSLEDRETREFVSNAILRLPTPYREVLSKYVADGLTSAQIASSLMRSHDTVRSQIRRGMRMLRSSLPASLAGVALVTPRGLPTIREVVIEHGHVVCAPRTAPWLGAYLVTKSTAVLATTLIAAAVLVFVWQPFGTPDDSTTPADVHSVAGVSADDDRERELQQATRQDSTDERRQVEPSGPDARYLAALATFTGRVTDAFGASVDGTNVQILRIASDLLESEGPPPLVAGEARTAADGRFEIEGIRPHGAYLLRAGTDRADVAFRMIQMHPGPGETVDLGVIALPQRARVVGRVVDEDGQGLAGASVVAVDLPLPHLTLDFGRLHERALVVARMPDPVPVTMPAWLREMIDDLAFRRATSAADGTFVLEGIPAGSISLFARLDGLAPARATVRTKAGQTVDAGMLRILEGEVVSGRVEGPDGRPIAGAQLRLGGVGTTAPVDLLDVAVETDATGTFEATGLPRGRIAIAARRGRDADWQVQESVAAGAETTIRLQEPRPVTLTVRGQTAIDQIQVSATRTLPGDLGSLSGLGFAPERALDARFENGAFALPALGPGLWSLTVSAEGHAATTVRAQLPTDAPLTVTLEAARALQVRVLASDGKPLRHAAITWSANDAGGFVGHTNASGSVTIAKVPNDTVTVRARHPEFASAETTAELGVDSVEIRFPAPGSIVGVVRAPDGTPREAAVTLTAMVGNGVPRSVLSGADGRFTINGVPPGPYQAVANPKVRPTDSPGGLFEQGLLSGMMLMDDPTVEVRSGEQASIVLELDAPDDDGDDGIAVRGRLLISGRAPTELHLASASKDKLLWSHVAPNGSFEFNGVSGETFTLAIMDTTDPQAGHGTLFERSWDLPPAGLDLDLNWDTGAVEGIVVEDGPIEGVRVTLSGAPLTDPEANVSLRRRTKADGRFEMRNVPEGDYRLLARTPDGRQIRREEIRIRSGAVERLELKPTQ